ncbi:MAG: hypothetical protein ACOC9Y_04840 [Chloroflexota bacterium]
MDDWINERRRWIGPAAGLLVSLVIVTLPLILLEFRNEPATTLRLAVTGERISGLFADGSTRVLIMDSASRSDARSVTGRFSRPWEDEIDVIISPSSDFATAGLIEAMDQHPDARVIVAGVPGADQNWLEIERSVSDGDLTFVDTTASFALEQSTVTVIGAGNSGSGVLIQSMGAHVFHQFDEGQPPALLDALVTSNSSPASTPVTFHSASMGSPPRPTDGAAVALDRRQVVALHFERDALRVEGGDVAFRD